MRGSRRVPAALVVLAVASFVGAAPPDPPAIRLPSAPMVQPAPGAAVRLTAEILFVVDGDIPFLAFASPAGILKITKEEGPLRVRGKFADGNGQVETRTFRGKHLAIVEPAAKGTAELLIVPEGAKLESEAVRRTIQVVDGTGPIPPPDPKPPDPKPPDPPVPVGNVAWVVCVEETSLRTPAVTAVLGDLGYWKGLEGRGLKWRHYDVSSPDAKAKKYDVFAAQVGLPAVLLLDATGKVVRSAKLPATTAGITALLEAK